MKTINVYHGYCSETHKPISTYFEEDVREGCLYRFLPRDTEEQCETTARNITKGFEFFGGDRSYWEEDGEIIDTTPVYTFTFEEDSL